MEMLMRLTLKVGEAGLETGYEAADALRRVAERLEQAVGSAFIEEEHCGKAPIYDPIIGKVGYWTMSPDHEAMEAVNG